MGQPNAMNSVSASTADTAAKQSKQKNARANGYRAKELAEIRNSLRPFEQSDQLASYRASLRQQQQQQLNGEHLRQLEGEQQLLGDPGQQLRAASSLSESSTNSDSVSSVQDALNKLTLMGYDEVGYKHIRKIRGILILYLLNICTGTHCIY